MIKVWGSFSILVVVALVVLLAPAAVFLAPAVSVVEAAVTQELTANFSLDTAAVNGTWHGFTFGSGGGLEAPGARMEQFTRSGVNRTTTLSGCNFREYSRYTGTISGDISGSLDFKFNMWDFATDYPYTPDYHTGSHFGTMFGRGYVDEGGGDTFYFVMIADLDGTSWFSTAAGRGLLVSYDETGAYSGHKVIGSFDIDISSGVYSGTMNLRNYPPDEIVYQGITRAESDGKGDGALKEDNRDLVAEDLDLVYFNRSLGNYHTESCAYDEAGLEEATPGEEGPQTITSSPLGAGGLVTNSRNGFVDAGQVFLGVYREGVVTTNSCLDDTYATTGDDGTTHGWLYQILFLDMPYTTTWWPDQLGFMITSFDMPQQPTEDYAGMESYGENEMKFEPAFSGPCETHSNTTSWELRPTPKPLSCNPPSGSQGDTMNVTVSGRYFLRFSDFITGSSIDFGPGITVNYWTLTNPSPVDNNITVNITIDGGAALGYRDVNLTACFGNGTANETNQMGTLVDGFEVIAPTSNITGTVYEANCSPLAGADVVLSGPEANSTTTNGAGQYTFTVSTEGSYTVNVTKGGLTYAEKWANVTVLGSDVTCDFKGMDAPYRTAPDGLYVIKCSNLWLWGGGYGEFALDAQRVSDVLYAWTHPS